MFEREAETLGCCAREVRRARRRTPPARRTGKSRCRRRDVSGLLDIVDRAATHGASRIYLAPHAAARASRTGCKTVGESGGAGFRRADGVEGHERRL